MKLTFLGAAHEVTGSRFLLETNNKRIMIDYGMEQGIDLFENSPLPLPAAAIDCMLLTHAHIDHSGYLPLLYKQGYRNPIYTTRATAELCRIMLLDSAHIQESDAEYKNRKGQRNGKPPVEPLYTVADAEGLCSLLRPCAYHQKLQILEGVSITPYDAGHLLGSASFEMTLQEDGTEKTLVFSGDIGNSNQPLLRNPEYVTKADFVVMESTYGDRSHGPRPDYIASLTDVLQRTLDAGGNLLIPSFAVGRTQEMLYFIREIKQKRLVRGHEHFPVYVDSPLGIEATQVFSTAAMECANEDTMALLQAGVNPLAFDDLVIASNAEESKQINTDPTPKVIISASGMCDAGRIRHHLKHNLWRKECTVLFVGYQSAGTLGRLLVDGVKKVQLFGETICVEANIETLAGISGHADQQGLMKWISAFQSKPEQVFVVHGEDTVTDFFANKIQKELHFNAVAPYNGECWSLSPLQLISKGNQERLKLKLIQKLVPAKTKKAPSATGKKARGVAIKPIYNALLDAMNRLQALVAQAERLSEREQSRLTKAINHLLKKYDK